MEAHRLKSALRPRRLKVEAGGSSYMVQVRTVCKRKKTPFHRLLELREHGQSMSRRGRNGILLGAMIVHEPLIGLE